MKDLEVFSISYFLLLSILPIFTAVLYYSFRKKSLIEKKRVIYGLCLVNCFLYFLRFRIEPFASIPDGKAQLFFTTVGQVLIVFAPLFFRLKNPKWRDFLYYAGILTGLWACLCPTAVLGRAITDGYLIYYYVSNYTLIASSALMVLFGVHTLDYRRIWRAPFIYLACLLFVMSNVVLMAEYGYGGIRSEDFYAINYNNDSGIWGPTNEIGRVFSTLTPDVFKTLPAGSRIGTEKYWPVFYLLPALFIYGIPACLFLALPTVLDSFWADVKKLYLKATAFYARCRTRLTNPSKGENE